MFVPAEVVVGHSKLTSKLVLGCIMATCGEVGKWIVLGIIWTDDKNDSGDNIIISWEWLGYLWGNGYY